MISKKLICAVILLLLIATHSVAEVTYINSWCLNAINAPAELIKGEHPVRIAVIDSGLRAGAAPNIDLGYNYVFNTVATADLLGHGTQTTSIIVGSIKGKLAGLAPEATIIPLVWISKYQSGVLANGGVKALSRAVRDAVDIYNCQVLNISSGLLIDDPELKEAVAYAEEKGAIVVSAVGNTNSYAPNVVYYPAAYDTVVGVGSINTELQVSSFSQRNSSVYVTAPGEKVYALPSRVTKGVAQVSGTSYAGAYVSSLAALLLSHNPQLTPAEFRQILQESAQDFGEPGYDTAYGYGLIDVAKALLLATSN